MAIFMGYLRCSDDDTVPPQAGPAPTSGDVKHQLEPEHDTTLDKRLERSQLFVTEWSFADSEGGPKTQGP
jgi:hypothetical protein